MRRVLFIAFTALLVAPAFAVAGNPPSPADRAAAVKQCRALRTTMGLTAFRLLYVTTTSPSSAFGKCVSTQAQLNEQDRSNAAASCRTARSSDPATFASHWGKGHDAFGKCVSATAKAAATARQQATINAAKACLAERTKDLATFQATYGKGHNAFGKCVSTKAKQK